MELLLIYVLIVIVSFIALKLKNRKAQTDAEKEKNRRRFLIIIFIMYVILIAILLLFSGSYRRDGNIGYSIKLFSKEHFELYSNFIPFATIGDFIKRLAEEKINTSIVITNILGNIAVFAPFGVFIPLLFKEKFNKFWKFLLLMIGTVFAVECIQFVTLRGAFDIDDIILNVFGACIVFALMKIKWINNVIERILE